MKVWILNHYATDMYFDSGGRHHSLAKYLIKLGHDVKIFCANTEHNSSRIVDTKGCLYVGEQEKIRFHMDLLKLAYIMEMGEIVY